MYLLRGEDVGLFKGSHGVRLDLLGGREGPEEREREYERERKMLERVSNWGKGGN